MTADVPDTTLPTPRGGPVDARIARSRRVLVDAMLTLLREGAGEELTISAICTRAGVSRSTFYQHFSSPEALLSAAVTERLDGLVARDDDRDTEWSVPELIAAVLTELDADGAAGAYRATLGDVTVIRRLQATLERWIGDRLRAAHPHSSSTRLAFAAGGVTRALSHWMEAGPARPTTDELAGEIWRLVESVISPDTGPAGD